MNHTEDLVADFNEQILGIKRPPKPRILTTSELEIKTKMMKEELLEFGEAITIGDTIGAIDALIDLQYFLIGTAHLMGVSRETFNECFQAVHDANMSKKRGVRDKRKTLNADGEPEPDAIKPEGWIPPEERLQKILGLE